MGNFIARASQMVYVAKKGKKSYVPVKKVTLSLEEMLQLTTLLRNASISEEEYLQCLANGEIPLAGTIKAKACDILQ